MIRARLENRYPSHQNAIELFEDRWLTRIEEVHPGLRSGPGRYLRYDRRPVRAANQLGFVAGSLHGMSVLELGPMEGAHTYQLAKLGAGSVLAIEANTDAYLRCLVLKEILEIPNSRFLLGDFVSFLKQNETRFDLIFCSGVLYHMEDPFDLIQAMSRRTDRVFLWTHFFDPTDPKGPACQPEAVRRESLDLTYYRHTYADDVETGPFWGGIAPSPSWLWRDDIRRIFEHFGFTFELLEENRNLDVGHHFTAVAIRGAEFNRSFS